MRSVVEVFPGVQRAMGEHATLTSLVVAVPFEDPAHGTRMIEQAHREVKPEAVAAGVMVGEFGRLLGGGGSRYPEIRTRRSMRFEFFAIRTLLLTGADSKYMTDPASRAVYERRLSTAREAR